LDIEEKKTVPPTPESILQLLDLSNMFIGGHSFGAASTITVVQDPSFHDTFRACFLHDLWPFPLSDSALDKGSPIPTLSILSEQFTRNSEVEYTRRFIRRGPCYSFYIKGTHHQNFADAMFWFPPWLVYKLGISGDLGIDRSREIIVQTTIAFLQGFLEPPIGKFDSKEVQKKAEELIPFGTQNKE